MSAIPRTDSKKERDGQPVFPGNAGDKPDGFAKNSPTERRQLIRQPNVARFKLSAGEALYKSEKLVAASMDHLPGFSWIKDLSGRYVYANKNLQELGPYRKGWLGKTDADLWPEEIASAYRRNDQHIAATKKAIQTVEPYLLDEEECIVLVSKFPIFDDTGKVCMVGGASVDISDRSRAETALSRMGRAAT